MKDKNVFELAGAVAKKYVNDAKTFAVLTLETSVKGFVTKHEIKAFKEQVADVSSLGVGEMIEVTGSIGRMSSQDCEYAKIPGKEGKDGKIFYPALPVLRIDSIRRMQGAIGDDDSDSIPD